MILVTDHANDSILFYILLRNQSMLQSFQVNIVISYAIWPLCTQIRITKDINSIQI